jgi:hypothetical protein
VPLPLLAVGGLARPSDKWATTGLETTAIYQDAVDA